MSPVPILSYNVHCVPVQCTLDHCQRVAEHVSRCLDSQRPTNPVGIVVLNEAFLKRVPRALEAMFKARNRTHGDEDWTTLASAQTRRPSLLVSHGVIMFWDRARVKRVETEKPHVITFDTCCQFDCLSEKGAVHVPFVSRQGVAFDVIGTHLQAYELPVVCGGVRRRQRRTIGAMIKHLKSARPWIVVGDMNEAPSKSAAQDIGGVAVPCGDANACPTFGGRHQFDHAVTNSLDTFPRFRVLRVPGNPSDHEPILV